MAFTSDSIDLLFKITASSDQARKEITDFSKVVERETGLIKSKTTNLFGDFAQGLGLSAERSASLSAALPVVGSAIAGIGAAAVGAGGALFGLAKNFSDYGSAIFDVTQKTGLSAEAISTLKLAADQSGSSLEAISGSVTKFSKLIGSATEGSKSAAASLTRLGLDPKEAINDLDGSLEAVFKRIYDAKNPIVATKLATEAFGKSGADLIPVIKQMDGDFDAFKETAKKLGVVLTDEDAKAADDFGDSLTELQSVAASVARTFAKEFTPEITKSMGVVEQLLVDNKGKFAEWGQAVGDIIRGISLPSAPPVPKEKSQFYKSVDEFNNALYDTARFVMDHSSSGGLAKSLSLENAQKAGATARQIEEEQNKNVVRASSNEYSKITFGKVKTAFEELNDGVKKSAKAHKDAIATLLPKGGEGFLAYASAGKRFGTANTIENVERLSEAFKATTGKILGIGEIAVKGGGNFGSHKEHGGGTSVDIRPVRQDGSGAPVTFRDLKNYDQDATRKLVQLIKSENPGAIVLFNDPQLIKEGLTRRAKGHDNHLHARNLGGDGKEIDLQAIEDKRAEKLFKSQDEAQKRSESLVANSLKTTIGNLHYEVALREDANKIILAKQEGYLAQGLINEQGFARVRIALEDDTLNKKRENKEIELQLTEEFNRNELAAFDAQAKRELARAKPEDKADVAAKSADERAALLAKQLEDETRIKREGQKIDDEITAKTIDNQNKIADGARKTAEARKAAAAEILELQRQVLDAERDLEIFRAEQERKILVNTVEHSSGRAKLDGLVVLREFDLKENERQRDADLKRAKREHDDALAKIKDLEAEREKVKAINDLYEQRVEFINQQRNEKAEATNTQSGSDIAAAQGKTGKAGSIADIIGGVVGGGVDPLNQIKTQADYMKAVHADLASSSKAAIGSMVQGLGQLAAQWLSTGKFSAKAALQMVSGIATGLAIEAGLKALMEYAEGLAMLANPFTAALAPGHFAAAAAYGTAAAAAGAIGVGTGLAARAFGGGAGGSSKSATGAFVQTTQGRTSSGNGGSLYSGTDSGNSSNNNRTIDEARFRQTNVTHTVNIAVQSNDSHIANVVQENINNRGGIHGLILKVVDP